MAQRATKVLERDGIPNPRLRRPRLLMKMNSPANLVDAWRKEAVRLRELGQDGLAKAMAHVAQQLALSLKAEAEAEVTIPEASEICGLSQEWLRHLVKTDQLPGRRHGSRYLVRVSSLPPRRAPKASVVDELAARRAE